jgi:hypothetical protein
MPNWKKVITSGSNAILNEITSSGGITGDLKLQQQLVSNQTVGGISSGETFNEGSSLETLIRTMLITFIQGTLGAPGLKNNGGSVGTGTREVNSSFDIDQVTFTATDNDPNSLYPINLTVTGSGASTGNFQNDLTSEILGFSNTFNLDSDPYTINVTSITAGYSKNFTLRINAEDPTNSAALTATRNYQYIYPYYWGESSTDLSSATGTTLESTAGINKVLSGRGNKTHSIDADEEFIYFSYPQLYGNLAQIKDGTNVDVLPDNFTQYSITIDGGNGWTSVPYYIYRSNTVTTVAGSYKFNFTAT